jgi:hypothetical protein
MIITCEDITLPLRWVYNYLPGYVEMKEMQAEMDEFMKDMGFTRDE